jgi:transposase InsO family protein
MSNLLANHASRFDKKTPHKISFKSIFQGRLSHHLFESIQDVQAFASQWLWTYNNERPNMALGGITPMQKLTKAI